MPALKYSRQRESIKRFLLSTPMWSPILILSAGNAIPCLIFIWKMKGLSMKKPSTYFRELSKDTRYSITVCARNARRNAAPDVYQKGFLL